MNEPKIGVFICHCGGNISDYVDVEDVRTSLESDPRLGVVKTHMFTCSDSAQQDMIEDIRNEKLNGLVIASCSPKLHMYTFRGMAERAGINPYQYVQVNLREQCSWVHRKDRANATRKGIALVRAGVEKCIGSDPLQPYRVETLPQALVIGAGIAGLRAALALSDLGISVNIVEKSPEPGGHVGEFGAMYPNDRNGRDIIDTLVKQVRSRGNITIFTDSEVIGKSGSVGNFAIRIRAKEEEISLKAGAIVVATGFDSYTPAGGEFGYGLDGVMTLPEFKRLADSAQGRLMHNGKAVETITYLYCVGSRQNSTDSEHPNEYCSRYCCTAGCHSAIVTHDIDPHIRQFHVFRDMRTYGKNELMYEQARAGNSLFLRCPEKDRPAVEMTDRGLVVRTRDELTGNEEIEIPSDIVVLVTGMTPRDNKGLIDVLKIPVDKAGFFNEIHLKLRPVETVIDGVFLAGACQSPKTAAESVGSALAAVSKSAALLLKGYVDLEPLVAVADTDKCTWCGECLNVCPYQAVEKVMVDGKPVARINESLCKGEGACVPICPESALDVKGYGNMQITGMIEALAKEGA